MSGLRSTTWSPMYLAATWSWWADSGRSGRSRSRTPGQEGTTQHPTTTIGRLAGTEVWVFPPAVLMLSDNNFPGTKNISTSHEQGITVQQCCVLFYSDIAGTLLVLAVSNKTIKSVISFHSLKSMFFSSAQVTNSEKRI